MKKYFIILNIIQNSIQEEYQKESDFENQKLKSQLRSYNENITNLNCRKRQKKVGNVSIIY